MTEFAIIDPANELPHTPDDDPLFQESALFAWHDLKSGVGGFWRLGQEPNAMQLNSCFGVFTSDGTRFRKNVTGAAMAASDRGDTFMGYGPELRVDLDTLTIKADFPDCEVEIRFNDFFPRYNWYQLLGRPVLPTRNHFEVAGSVAGHVKIGGREIAIDGLGYRDRSWGHRTWTAMRGTRWWPSVFGPDLSMFLSASIHEPDICRSFGYMVRDGVPQTLRDVDVAVLIDSDAISPRAGIGTFRMESGEIGEVRQERVDGIVLHVRGYTAVESIGRAYFGDRVGISNLEVCTNPTGGNLPPILTIGADNGDGLSTR